MALLIMSPRCTNTPLTAAIREDEKYEALENIATRVLCGPCLRSLHGVQEELGQTND